MHADTIKQEGISTFSNVQLLELHTCFNKKNVSGLAFLVKSSPILHTLALLKIDNDNKIERRTPYCGLYPSARNTITISNPPV
ncbi:hypothetical protein LINGRAHAP2_LOCUS28716 [Linum grandiflorum]